MDLHETKPKYALVMLSFDTFILFGLISILSLSLQSLLSAVSLEIETYPFLGKLHLTYQNKQHTRIKLAPDN